MRRSRTVLTIASAVVLAVGGAALALRIYLGRDAESRLRPDELIDFAARNSAGRSNVFAMCPPNYCVPEADRESPVFAMSRERLRDYWREVMATQPRLELVAADPARHRLVFIQRSPTLRFPDVITVEFVALGDDISSLAIDSRSRYGHGDMGVNRKRVTDWVAVLEQIVGQNR